MLPDGNAAAEAVTGWLTALEQTLASGNNGSLRALFRADSHWRDVLALTGDIDTINGGDAIPDALSAAAATAKPRGFQIDPARTPPRRVKRAGTDCIEAIIRFETPVGRCNGILRLTADPAQATTLEAWTFMTALDEIAGHEEIGRPGEPGTQEKAFSRDFHGPNWLDLRKASAAYADREPAVVVVGAGQAGLSIAARLRMLGVDTLLIERNVRIGDNWRNRYHALTLHNQAKVNHLPYMMFPPGWPAYIPKDKLAGWFEQYAESMELNAWTGTELVGGSYDDANKRWNATVRRPDGTTRSLHPRHLVMATSSTAIPNIPEVATLDRFKGTVVHSSRYKDSESWRGKRALVIGTGTSGHDIAQDLHAAGAHVSIAQRTTTMVVNIEPSAQLPYTLYDEGPPLADCDLVTVGVPLPVLRRSYQMVTAEGRRIDTPLLERLERRGFRLDFGEDGTGWQYKYLTRGGGYYFNVGCSDLIADGEVGLVQFRDIETFEDDGVRLRDGSRMPVDLVVLATGYKGPDALVRQLLGDAIADRIGPVWGFGERQELRNIFKRTAQPGLWFISGSFAQCRIYSKYLALQIKADEVGLGSFRSDRS